MEKTMGLTKSDVSYLKNSECFKDFDEDNFNSTESFNKTHVYVCIANLISEIIEENALDDKKPNKNKSKMDLDKNSSFNSSKPPGVSILDYLQRILKYCEIEDSTLVIALINLDRYCDFTDMEMNNINIHRLLLASIVVSIKFNEDDYFANTYYAKVGGITLTELNILESEFLKSVKYNLFVHNNLYNKYKNYLDDFKS